MSSKEKSMWDSLTPEEQQEFWNGMSQSEQIAFAQDMKTSVAGDFVSPPSTGYSARMKKKVLGVAMVVVFCITWWQVAGKAWLVYQQEYERIYNEGCAHVSDSVEWEVEHAYEQFGPNQEYEEEYERAHRHAKQAYQQAKQAYEQAKQAQQASKQAEQEYEQVYQRAQQAYQQAKQAYDQACDQAHEQAKQAYDQASEQASEKAYELALDNAKKASAEEHSFMLVRATWGIGAGLYADVVLLVGVLAWSKLTAKA